MVRERKTISDDELTKVSGGAGYVTKNNSCTRSGDTPLYSVGERVKVKWEPYRPGFESRWDEYIVTHVSSTPDGGYIFKEFTYTLKRESSDFTLNDVYESCIKKA